jgi:signal transduction histidine kinase
MLTMFAPAERAAPHQLQADVAHFGDQALLQEFFAAVSEMFVVLNEQRQIVFANQALLSALQITDMQGVAGQRLGEALHCVHAVEDGAALGGCGTTEFCRECGALRAMLNSLRGAEDVQECRIARDNGACLDLRVATRPLAHDGRRFVLFAVTDISHEKRRRVLERIFFHDLLNTAGGMLGVAELLRTGSAEEVADFKDLVSLLASSLVDEIKAQQMLLAAERGELALQPERVNCYTLLCELRSTYINHDVCIGRLIEVDPLSDVMVLTSDPRLLRRVLGNMLKNALEACTPGQSVRMRCRAAAGGVELSVHNPGCMPRSTQLQVFQRSFTSKGDGRGLGAYSMKLLTERYLGGHISFTSTSEEGTTFRAWYPLQMAEA